MDDKTIEQFKNIVNKIVENKINSIVRSTQNVITTGFIADINYTSNKAIVNINGSNTGWIDYPSVYTNSEIGPGSKVIIVSPDPNLPKIFQIVAVFGNFFGQGTPITNNEWEFLGGDTITDDTVGDSIRVSPLKPKKYLRIVINVMATGGNISIFMRFNGDSTATYARRDAINGAADGTVINANQIPLNPVTGALPSYAVVDVLNIATSEKLVIGHTVYQNVAGAGTAPQRLETVGKWTNTTDLISEVNIENTSTGDFAVGSEVSIYGHN